MKDVADLAVGESIALDELAVSCALLLKLCERRRVHHGGAGLELMDMRVYQFGRSSFHGQDRKQVTRRKQVISFNFVLGERYCASRSR